MTKRTAFYFFLLVSILFSSSAFALELGAPAPLFSLKNQEGKLVTLKKNKEKTWTVLYFFPKAGTPGCTTQAMAFRDSIQLIEKEKAVVYGISTDSVFSLKEFQKNHHLNFDLLSDEDGKVTKEYGTKMPIFNMSKRVTFILDDQLNIRNIDTDVDPSTDARKVAEKIHELKGAFKP